MKQWSGEGGRYRHHGHGVGLSWSAHAVLPIANKGASGWSYAIVPIVGPLIGGGLAGLLLHAVIK